MYTYNKWPYDHGPTWLDLDLDTDLDLIVVVDVFTAGAWCSEEGAMCLNQFGGRNSSHCQQWIPHLGPYILINVSDMFYLLRD